MVAAGGADVDGSLVVVAAGLADPHHQLRSSHRATAGAGTDDQPPAISSSTQPCTECRTGTFSGSSTRWSQKPQSCISAIRDSATKWHPERAVPQRVTRLAGELMAGSDVPPAPRATLC